MIKNESHLNEFSYFHLVSNIQLIIKMVSQFVKIYGCLSKTPKAKLTEYTFKQNITKY